MSTPSSQKPQKFHFDDGEDVATAELVRDIEQGGHTLWLQTSVNGIYIRPDRIDEFANGLRAAAGVNDKPVATPLTDAPICTPEAAREAGLDIAPSLSELTAMAETIVAAGGAPEPGTDLARAVPLLATCIERLRVRVAELEQHTTTEAVPCVRPEPHPAHLHSGLRNGTAVHGRCPGVPAEEPLVVSRFDVAMEPAPDEEPVLTIGAVAEDGRPVALLLDPETRAKVARWLGPDRAEVLREAARLLEDTGRDDDAVNLLDNLAAAERDTTEGGAR